MFYHLCILHCIRGDQALSRPLTIGIVEVMRRAGFMYSYMNTHSSSYANINTRMTYLLGQL